MPIRTFLATTVNVNTVWFQMFLTQAVDLPGNPECKMFVLIIDIIIDIIGGNILLQSQVF